MLTTNQTLQQNRYRIINQLGQIETGLGYEAFDSVLGTNVLLKETLGTPNNSADSAQFQTEKAVFDADAKILRQLDHHALLTVKDSFSEADRHYLVMEYFDGKTLGELLEKRKNPFPVKNVAVWADALLAGLNHLHTQNPPLIHSNIKPQNIKLSADGKIVKLFVLTSSQNAAENARRTGVNQTFDGTILPYLPIEQIWLGLDVASQKVILSDYDEKSAELLEQPLDAQSDLYAIGATLYHLLTGRVPADALTRSIDLLEGKTDPLRPPHQVNSSVPVEISEIVMRALQIKRENRFGSAGILRQVWRTAFARAEERATHLTKPEIQEDDAVLEIPTPSRVAPVQPKNIEIESEQARQLELIKQQLREAEARRLEAEKRAAEAEKRLQESTQFSVNDLPAGIIPPMLEAVPPAVIANDFPSMSETNPRLQKTADDFTEMFVRPESGRSSFVKVAAGTVLFLVIGGTAWGIWNFSGKSDSNAPTVSAETSVSPTVTSPPVLNIESATISNNTETSVKPETVPETAVADAPKTTENPTAVKTKQTPTPPQQAKKQPTPQPKSSDSPKKSVTLDDLLKDN